MTDTAETSSSSTKTENPSDADVLLGRGKPYQNHPGNRYMLGLVDKFRDQYQRAERKEKHTIIEEVLSLIEEKGGRFLQRADYDNKWVEVNKAISYRKVGHAFRSKARRNGGSSKKKNARLGFDGMNHQGATMDEQVLLAEMRMRRAAEMMNFNNFSPLERLIMNQGLNPALNPGLNPGLYGGFASGLVGGGGLLGQQQSANLLGNAALFGNGLGGGLAGTGLGNGLGNGLLGAGATGVGSTGAGAQGANNVPAATDQQNQSSNFTGV